MKQIAAALVKAQRAFGPALKTSLNPHLKAKYADLSEVIGAVIDGLNANGIFLMQSTHEREDGVVVETVFVHESGEFLSAGKLHVPASKQDAQGFGSALTYARRYSLMAACGVAPEDDDANAASKPKTQAADPEYHATHYDQFRSAAECGSDALAKIFNDTPASPDKNKFWATYGAEFKALAKKFDKITGESNAAA